MNTTPPIKYTRQTLGSGIYKWNVECTSDVGLILNQLKGDLQSTITTNTGKIALSIPGFTLDEEDLFAQAPPDIRKDNALHVSPVDYTALYLIDLCLWAVKDCGLFIHSNQPAESLKEKKRVFWAWFSKPSILLHQAKVGSQGLAEKIFDELEMVVIIQKLTPTEASLVILSPPSASEYIEKILSTHSNASSEVV